MNISNNLFSINDVKIIELSFFPEERGDLVVIEHEINCPFNVKRTFSVRAPLNEIRGDHAHKECGQFAVCLNGEVECVCDDGVNKKTFLLNSPNYGLYIPKSIWQLQKYTKENSVLLFLCDLPYDSSEYIHEYDEFLKYRSKIN